jgi:hypothetical protein
MLFFTAECFASVSQNLGISRYSEFLFGTNIFTNVLMKEGKRARIRVVGRWENNEKRHWPRKTHNLEKLGQGRKKKSL